MDKKGEKRKGRKKEGEERRERKKKEGGKRKKKERERRGREKEEREKKEEKKKRGREGKEGRRRRRRRRTRGERAGREHHGKGERTGLEIFNFFDHKISSVIKPTRVLAFEQMHTTAHNYKTIIISELNVIIRCLVVAQFPDPFPLSLFSLSFSCQLSCSFICLGAPPSSL